MTIGRPRTLPDALPRACKNCGTVYTPARKKWRSIYCCIACQRQACMRDKALNAELSRQTAQKRGDTQRGRGDGRAKYRKRGGQHEHRTVVEEQLGRKLQDGEIVHHRNVDSLDNDPGNLEVKASQAEHAREHMLEIWQQRKQQKGGMQ